MSKLRIGLYMGSWPQNIGNAFFDLGAMAILKKAVPDAEIIRVGGAVHWMFNASSQAAEPKLARKARKFFNKPINNTNSFEIGQFADVDLLVFAGMSMCEEFVMNNGKTFIAASQRGVPTLLLGTGGSHYTDRESNVFSEFLNKLGNCAVITRDDDSFNMFNGKVKNIEAGIDCAFFLPDYFSPPKLQIPEYNVECFDEKARYQIDHKGKTVLRAHHDMWGYLKKEYISEPMTLVSDVPEDYLTLYSQSKETYSDRVHACVATLAYGNKARLFSATPRKALFNKVGIPKVTTELTTLNQDLLLSLKSKQIDFAKSFIAQLVK